MVVEQKGLVTLVVADADFGNEACQCVNVEHVFLKGILLGEGRTFCC